MAISRLNYDRGDDVPAIRRGLCDLLICVIKFGL
jgi:hypothetical protein